MSHDVIFPQSEERARMINVGNAYHQLACEILRIAVEHWKLFGNLAHPVSEVDGSQGAFERAEEMGYSCPRIELLAFFWSRWCGLLCEEAGIGYEDMMKRIDAPLRIETSLTIR